MDLIVYLFGVAIDCQSYINLRYTFEEVKKLLTDNIADLLMIAESNLDNTFLDNLFQVDGYNLQRRDRDQHGVGLLTLIKSDFLSSRKKMSRI